MYRFIPQMPMATWTLPAQNMEAETQSSLQCGTQLSQSSFIVIPGAY